MTESSTPASTPETGTRPSDKPKFVYLAGASGTGKSALMAALAERLNAKTYTGAARGVIARWPVTPQEMLAREDKSEYYAFQKEVLEAQRKLEYEASWEASRGHSAVLDRGIDHLAYLAHFCPLHFATEEYAVRRCLDMFGSHLTGSYVTGLAVYLPPVPEFVARARAERPVELQPWLTDSAVAGVDAAIKGLLTTFAHTGRVLSLAGVTDLQQRVDAVLAQLRAIEGGRAYPA